MGTAKEEFKPDITDVEAEMGYCKEGVTLEMYIGWEILLPCALGKLVMFVKKEVLELSVEMEKDHHNVTILDARKNNPGKFHETGFTLIELEDEPVTKDWRTPTAQDPNADITHFHKQM